jgi:hypothetical protein
MLIILLMRINNHYITNTIIFQTTYGIVMKMVFKLVGNLTHECLQKGDHKKFTTQYQNERNG